MNDYRISYTLGGEVETTTITERNEAAAQKFFKTVSKAGTITDIELIRENTCATKQQERDTLEAIRKMVEELGPQSHLAIAFEGCFEVAESNIEDDFADSMKARWEEAEKRLIELNRATTEEINHLKEQLSESEKDYEAACAETHAIAEQKDVEIAALRARVISPDDLTDVIQLVTEKKFALDTESKKAAERIVEMAVEPESAAFRNAVTDHRAAKSDLNYYTALFERLVHLTDSKSAG